MAIVRPEAFAQSPSADFDGVFDWDFLRPAFAGTKIMPMDFDCVVERGGKFLCFETKNKGVEVPNGQRRALENAVMTGPWTVIILRGKCASDINGWEVWCRGRHSGRFEQCPMTGNADDLVGFVRRWFLNASKTTTARPEVTK